MNLDLAEQTLKEMRSAVDLARQFRVPVADDALVSAWADQLEKGIEDYRRIAKWCADRGIEFDALASAAGVMPTRPCAMCLARDCTCACATCTAARHRRDAQRSQGDGAYVSTWPEAGTSMPPEDWVADDLPQSRLTGIARLNSLIFRRPTMAINPGQYPLKTAGECWEEFLAQVVPAGAPPSEVNRAKMCFYAGVAFMFDQNMAVGNPAVPETDGEAHLASIGLELQVYARELAAAVALPPNSQN